jgi:hypothetical protein
MISLFCQDLRSFPPDRAKRLHLQSGIARVYALVWHDYLPPIDPIPQMNRAAFGRWRQEAGVPLWGWFNCREDQAQDAADLMRLQNELHADGWTLDIEGSWTKGSKLTVLLGAAGMLGVPVYCSLAATTPAHVEYDYRGIDAHGFPIDWQCYFDSGEGQAPDVCVREAYQCSFVIPGWNYRAVWGKSTTWGQVGGVVGARADYNAFKRAGTIDGTFKVGPRAWGVEVDADRTITRAGVKVGSLLGRAKYKNIRVTLDVTRGADGKHTPAEWAKIAASARAPGLARRPVSVYLAENASDETLAGIAAGAA